MPPADWSPLAPVPFVDRRERQTRDGRLVTQRVRSWAAVISRPGADGRQELDRCRHAHQKVSAARRCGVARARRANRA